PLGIPRKEDHDPPRQLLVRRRIVQPAGGVCPGHARLLAEALRSDDDVGQVEVNIGKGGDQLGVKTCRPFVTLPAVAALGELVDAILCQRRDEARQIPIVFGHRVSLPELPDLVVLVRHGVAPDPLDDRVVLYVLLNSFHNSSIVVARPATWTGSYGDRPTARTIQSSPTSSTLMQAGVCSKLPRKVRPPVSAYERIALLTPPWRTARTTSQPSSARSRSTAGNTRSKSEPIVSPPRKRTSSGRIPRNAPTNACSSSSTGMFKSRDSSSRSSGHDSASTCGATMCAVSSVRLRPLVIKRSKVTSSSMVAAARAWSRPASVSGTSCESTGRPSSK